MGAWFSIARVLPTDKSYSELLERSSHLGYPLTWGYSREQYDYAVNGHWKLKIIFYPRHLTSLIRIHGRHNRFGSDPGCINMDQDSFNRD